MGIAGDLNLDCHQGLESIITDRKFYDENKYKFLPNPNADLYENKKLLGCSVEHESDVEISLCPKSCMLFDEKEYNKSGKGSVAKCKGFTVKDGNLTKEDYMNVVSGKSNQIIKETTQIRSNFSNVIKKTINKVSLSVLNNKGIVQNNQSQTVLPFYKC
jgi:hypothetical protein